MRGQEPILVCCCNPMEALFRSLAIDNEISWRQLEAERDHAREHTLGREHAVRFGEDPECAWPWYADPWWEVEAPEIFET